MLRQLDLFNIIDFLLKIPVVLWAISFHEFCHGYAAKLLGDRTAEMQGRLTLNPIKHFDPIGVLMLFFAGFGWAKPVPVNSRYFKNVRRDIVIVSLAGIAGNLLTAFVFALIGKLLVSNIAPSYAFGRAMYFINAMIFINVSLAAFNILPIPPLDGSKILYSFIPFKWLRFYYSLEQYGMYILLIMVFTNTIQFIMTPIMFFFLRLIGAFG